MFMSALVRGHVAGQPSHPLDTLAGLARPGPTGPGDVYAAGATFHFMAGTAEGLGWRSKQPSGKIVLWALASKTAKPE